MSSNPARALTSIDRFQVAARSSGGRATPKDVVLAENQWEDGVLLAFKWSGARVLRRVSGLPREKLAGVEVSASADDYRDDTLTDETGQFTFNEVPPGAVELDAMAHLRSWRTASKTAEVPEGRGDVTVEIVFEGGSRLSGRVSRADQPQSGLSVLAITDPVQDRYSRVDGQTDENGQYTLEGLSDGPYRLRVSGPGVSYSRTITVSGDTTADVSISSIAIAGKITEEGSGDPIAGATVQA